MNFKEICEAVGEEVNGRPLTFSSVLLSQVTDPFQRRVIKAVQTVYMRVLLHSRFWSFLNKRGKLLTIREGVAEYSLPGLQSIEWDSLYLTKTGTTAKWPIMEESYNAWQARERAATQSTGIPLHLIKATEPNKWLVWPVPSDTYMLNGNAQYKPSAFEVATDEPIWDEQYHDLLVWLAVRHLESRVKTQDEVISNLNAGEAQKEANARWGAFCAHYLPKIGSAKEFM